MGRIPSRTALLAATLALAPGVVRPAAAQTIVAGPTTTDVAALLGDEITVPVAIDLTGAAGIQLGAYRVRFTWNPGLFTFVRAAGGTFGAPVFNADSAADGVLRFAAASAAGASGLFVLGNVTLLVGGTSPDTLRVAFEELTAAGTFADLLPFLVVTQGAFCGGGVWGDLDGDGQVESADAQIVLMHAVGLPVSQDTTTGDVDANAHVDPRDALIILSDVVGLDVSAFRVGQLVSATCAPGDPDQVTVLPAPLALAAGDQFRLSSQVRDSAGVLLTGVNLVWSSDDQGIATVDSAGVVTAVAVGTTTLRAAVQPGVVGTVAVTVGQRHRWVVNPAAAQGQQDEIGSDLFPFSTIAAAVGRAAAGDTVFLAQYRYAEPLNADKPIAFVGDTAGGGMPLISTPNHPAGMIGAAGGTVVLRHLEIAEASSGLAIEAGVLDVAHLTLRSLNGPGLRARGTSRAIITGVSVSGAIEGGIGIDSAGYVEISNSEVTAVEPGATSEAYGIGVRADTAVFTANAVSAVDGPAIVTSGTQLMQVHGAVLSDAQVGIYVDAGVTLDVGTNVSVTRMTDGGIGGMVDTLRVGGTVTVRDVGGGALFAHGQAYDLVQLTGVAVSNAAAGFVSEFEGARATIQSSSFSTIGWVGVSAGADTLSMDGVTITLANGPAVMLGGATRATILNSIFSDVSDGIVEYGWTGYLAVTGTRIQGVLQGDGIYFEGDTLLLTNDTIAGVSGGYGVYQYGAGGGLLRARNSRVVSTAWNGIGAYNVALVDLVDVAVDSTNRHGWGYDHGISVYVADSVRVDSSLVRWGGGGALYVSGARVVTAEGNVFSRNDAVFDAGGGYSSYEVVYLYEVPASRIVGNQFEWNNAGGMELYLPSTGTVALVQGNVFRGRYQGIQATGYDTLTARLEVRGNTFVSDLGGDATEQVGVGWVREMILADNTFDSIVGWGADLWPMDSTAVTGNTATNVAGSGYVFFTQRGRIAVVDGNDVTCRDGNGATGFSHRSASGMFRNNTVTGCYQGLSFYNGLYTTSTADLVIRDNAVTQGTVTTPQRMGIHLEGGSYRAEIVGNQVSGGRYSVGALSVVGNTTYHHPRIRVDSNTVNGLTGYGIRIREADTVVVRGNTVQNMDYESAIGGIGGAGLALFNIYVSATAAGNAFTSNVGTPGVFVENTALGVTLDSNLIADHTGTGILLRGVATGTANWVRRNGPMGILDQNGLGSVFQANNIEDNAFGVANYGATPIDVSNSWWGDPLGPSCDAALGCDTGATGDSVTANVTFLPVAADSIPGSPVGAPPALAPMLVMAPSLLLAPAPDTTLPEAPPTTRERPEPVIRAPRERPEPPPGWRLLRHGALVPAGPTPAVGGGER